MKISELAEKTGVPKETIHFYLREGLLPKPRKMGKNVADYDEGCVDRIGLIKELQDNLFLPLSLIKAIIKRESRSPEMQALLRLRSEYLSPRQQLLNQEVIGEEAFMKATGLSDKWLSRMEQWGVITPKLREDQKAYSQDDVNLAKVIVKMGELGLGPRDGFDPETLKYFMETFREIVAMSQKSYLQAALGKLSPEEFHKRSNQAVEIMSVFFYHLHRKISREAFEGLLNLFERRTSQNGAAG